MSGVFVFVVFTNLAVWALIGEQAHPPAHSAQVLAAQARLPNLGASLVAGILPEVAQEEPRGSFFMSRAMSFATKEARSEEVHYAP